MGNRISIRGPLLPRAWRLPPHLDWWHHFIAIGASTTLFNLVWLNVAGGALFGIGLTWWVVGGAYDHRVRDWLND